MNLIIGMGQTGYDLSSFYLKKLNPQPNPNTQLCFFDTRDKPPFEAKIKALTKRHLIKFQRIDQTMINQNWINNLTQVYLSSSIKPADLPKNLLNKITDKNFLSQVFTDLDLFCLENKQKHIPTIAITGTNGKSSLCYYLNQLFTNAKIKTLILGNFKKGFLFALKQMDMMDIAILELSSFQLYHSKRHFFDMSAITNLSLDHLDWHPNFDHYKQAKYKIFHQSNIIFYDSSCSHLKDIKEQIKDKTIVDCNLTKQKNPLLKIDKFNQLSQIDQINFYFAYQIFIHFLRQFGLDDLSKFDCDNCVKKTLSQLKRLNFRNHQRVKHQMIWINDSKSTNTHSLIYSLKNCINKPSKKFSVIYLIMGGNLQDTKGLSFLDFANEISNLVTQMTQTKKHQLKQIMVYGSANQIITKALNAKITQTNKPDIFSSENLAKAVSLVYQSALQNLSYKNENIVLFSPGLSSLTDFKNYAARGEFFDQLVDNLDNPNNFHSQQ